MTLRLTPEQYAAAQARAKRTPAAKTMKASKYFNLPTGGYASAKEARRAQELKLLRDAGKIRNLREQVVYELIPKQGKERACKYVADFAYEEDIPARATNGLPLPGLWMPVVEDVKSPASRTAEYIIKRKLMLQVHGIAIRET